MNLFANFLKELAPYVIVVGSFARYTETIESDIDCFLRARPIEEIDYEIGDDSYMPEILKLLQKYRYITDSVIVGHIAVERQVGVPRMVEISTHYRIPYTEAIFTREIYGVPFLCAVDNKSTLFENCYDNTNWNDEVCSMIIAHPLPQYPYK